MPKNTRLNSSDVYESIYRENIYIPTVNLGLCLSFWSTWAYPTMPDSICCFYRFLLTYKISTSYMNPFLRYQTFKNPEISLVGIILGHNSRLIILSDMRFATRSQELYRKSRIRIFFRKIKWQNFWKKYKTPHFLALSARRKWFFKNWALSDFRYQNNLTICE